MREIKFRAKKLKSPNNEWVYGSYQHAVEWEDHFIWQQEKFGGFWRDIKREVDRATIGQFTGLKDKHGNEICEGDIVEVAKGRLHHYRVPVELDNYEEMESLDYHSSKKDAEIIGNIYEDSHLIGEESRK